MTSPIKLIVDLPITLSPDDVDRVFAARLDELIGPYFIKDGAIYERVDMEGRGSDFDEKVSDNLNDPRHLVAVIAWQLRKVLKTERLPKGWTRMGPPKEKP